jgi:hypothetical protein
MNIGPFHSKTSYMTMDINISLYLSINLTLKLCIIFSMLNFKVHFKSNNLFFVGLRHDGYKIKILNCNHCMEKGHNTINFE